MGYIMPWIMYGFLTSVALFASRYKNDVKYKGLMSYLALYPKLFVFTSGAILVYSIATRLENLQVGIVFERYSSASHMIFPWLFFSIVLALDTIFGRRP